MSLLLEALKKAELAKQNTAAGAADAATPVITREKLPDITQPLEILSDDLPSAREKAQVSQAPDAPEAEPASGQPAPAQPAAPGRARATPRDSARQLFEVKETEYNPRRPFYLTIGALVVVAFGYGGYLWWQLQPRSYPAQATAPTAQRAVEARAQISSAPVVAPGVPAAIAPVSAPQAQARQAPPPATAEAPAAATALGPAFVRNEPAAAAAVAASPRQPARPAIAVTSQPPQVDPLIERGYQSAQKGEFAAAREAYEQALAREPNSRDALLGLAALDVRAGSFETAEMRYQKLLELDPRDAHAQAALIGLRGQIDPVLAESRLKLLLASQPEAAHLHFALGNQYALQSRWAEAQAAYFRAYTADAENADYAFNLAVSLERLRQAKSALEYYRRALALSATRPAGFDRAQAEARVRELSK